MLSVDPGHGDVQAVVNDCSFDGVRIERGGAVILDNVSFTVPKGSVTAVLGPSGAGKSTLLHALTGELLPSRGTIEILQKPMPRSNSGLMGMRRCIGVLLQSNGDRKSTRLNSSH